MRSAAEHPRRGLRSASVTANADGTWNSEIKYTAFGEVRASYGLTPTDYRYTGQLDVAELGLVYFVARFYDPVLTHFVQADILIPQGQDILSWNRYAYTNYNPIIYSDPDGHNPIIAILALLGFGIVMSQVPGDTYQPENAGNPYVMLFGLSLMGPPGDFISTTVDCVTDGCDPYSTFPSYFVPGPSPSLVQHVSENVDNIAPLQSSTNNGLGTAALNTVYCRYCANVETDAIKSTGILRGGRPGDTFFTTDKYSTVQEAEEFLALPYPPEVKVEFTIKNNITLNGPRIVEPKNGHLGGGIEYWSSDPVKVIIRSITDLLK